MSRTVGELSREISGLATFADVLGRAEAWPPDLFAITSMLLHLSGAYRCVVSPPPGRSWPPKPDWCEAVERDAAKWVSEVNRSLLGDATSPPCAAVLAVRSLKSMEALPVQALDEPSRWAELTQIIQLHAVADEACAGLGLSDSKRRPANSPYPAYYFRAAERLNYEHTLSTFPTDRVRVLPKTRTPQSGITIRSLSHHAAVEHCDVDVNWIRTKHPSALDDNMRLRLLLFPWPFSVSSQCFAPATGTKFTELATEKFGYFDYAPSYSAGELERVFNKTLEIAIAETGDVDGAILPESAVTDDEFEALWRIAEQKGVHLLLAGVRHRDFFAEGRTHNTAVLRISTGTPGGQTWYQNKHHRWFLDRPQIETYKLAHSLNPARRWWENMVVGKRTLNVVAFNDWLTVCHLICEDLARIDPVSRLVRAIGPTLVLALLLDGPQLAGRWPARYATVLADDPGSSVLTLTSLGMAEMSRPENAGVLRTVALWKDSRFGTKALDLEAESSGIVLTLWGDRIEEFAADGRSDGTMAGRITIGDVRQVRGALRH